MDDKKAIMIEKIKSMIIEMIHYDEEVSGKSITDHIAEKLNSDYTYLSNTFSEVTGITIDHYIIAHKIERVKEMLLYDEMDLSAIAHKLNFNSVSHLSTQFKRVTGLTPAFFKLLKHKRIISGQIAESM